MLDFQIQRWTLKLFPVRIFRIHHQVQAIALVAHLTGAAVQDQLQLWENILAACSGVSGEHMMPTYFNIHNLDKTVGKVILLGQNFSVKRFFKKPAVALYSLQEMLDNPLLKKQVCDDLANTIFK